MPKAKDSEMVRVCVRLIRADYEYLREVSKTNGEIGLNLLIRQSVNAVANQFRARERTKIDSIPQAPKSSTPITITLNPEDFDEEPSEDLTETEKTNDLPIRQPTV